MDELITALRAAIRDEAARQLAELLPEQPLPVLTPELLSVEQAAARLGVQPKTSTSGGGSARALRRCTSAGS